jgi:hypothetical protein
VVLQLCLASAMILFRLPKVLRSLHEATGVGIWLSCFVLAYLARKTSGRQVLGSLRDHQDDAVRLRGPRGDDIGLART